MMTFHGLPVSKGIAIGRAFVYVPFKPKITESFISIHEVNIQKERLAKTIQQASMELDQLQNRMVEKDPDKAGIFMAHQDILTDDTVNDEILELMREKYYSGEYAIETVYEKYYSHFSEMNDDLMKERCADFRDIKNRILRIWMNADQQSFFEIEVPSIIFAHDLLPSDMAILDRKKVLAIVAETGGDTSHSAIIARSYEIPAILGVSDIMATVKNGTLAVVDALDGLLILDPLNNEYYNYMKKQAHYERTVSERKKYCSVEPVTRDGKRIEVCLNIGSVTDDELEPSAYTDGVGLFRSEFLFMSGRDLPDENHQFQVYKKATETYKERQVILRTLDIGGDKSLECMELPREENPFLGCRSLRFCFKNIDIFKTQLRAALRASVYGNLALMFPMVGSLEELGRAKEILDQCRQELDKKHIPYNKNMAVGIMIEIPSIALIAEKVTGEVDFASIGTNDLCQYLMAADRLNPEVAEYYKSYHPALFKIISLVSRAFLKAEKKISICGEMGGDPLAISAFIGMGINKFSMVKSAIPVVKQLITTLDFSETQELAETVINMSSVQEVKNALNDFYTNCSSNKEGVHVFKKSCINQ